MRLTSIKLSGFKSFVEPTNFQLSGQLVGVVGPNGCGKSNIIDAVRWVLGESRASELRGESMEDVIFNGTDNRKPAGRASVELIFDNSEGKASGQWGKYSEISVKRILTRDKTSSYYINNQVVRRRDVQEIFMGTGLGPRAYAIIGQGMISRILEARPEEMRVFLEEAAGVSIYKERRRETENRLHDARENIARLGDTLRELENNLTKLEEQAEVAKTFHSLQSEREGKQKLLWFMRRNEASAEREKISKQIEDAQLKLEEKIAGLRHAESQLENLRKMHFESGERLHKAQGDLNNTAAEIKTSEAQINFIVTSRSNLQNKLTSLREERDNWERQGQQHSNELNEARLTLEKLSSEYSVARENFQQHTEALPSFESAWREAQSNADALRGGISIARQKIELESAHHRNASNALADLTARRERLEQETKGLQIPDKEYFEQKKNELAAIETERSSVEQRMEMLTSQISSQEESLHSVQEQLQSETAKFAQLDAHLDALKQLQTRLQSEGKVQPWLSKHGLNELPRLWQKLNIEPGWETALEAVLRERTNALEVSNLDWAKAFTNDLPPARLFLYTINNSHIAAKEENIQGLRTLFGLLKINDPAFRTLLQDWLYQVYIAENLDDAFSLREKLPQGGLFVTRSGHLVSRVGIGFYAPDSEQDGMMARRQEIESLTKQARAQQLLADETRSRVVREESALSQTNQELQKLREQSSKLTQASHNLEMETLKLSEQQERVSQRSTQISEELEEISKQSANYRQIMTDKEALFEQLDIELATAQGRFEESQTVFLDKERILNDARDRLRELELAAQSAEFAQRTEQNRISELERNIAMAKFQSEKLAQDMQQGSLELETLDDETLRAGLQTLLEVRVSQEKNLSDARQELEQIERQIRQSDEGRLQIERSLDPHREQITQYQLKEQEARLKQEGFEEQLRNAEADEAALSELAQTEIKIPYLQGEVTRLSNAIEALGAVNLAAFEELESVSERKKNLDAQNKDLTDSISTMEDAIRRIDRETRERLQETFDKVNDHFGTIFPMLFGGGKAKLIMTGDEILDSGVQVTAQPPGKKNATIQLLSGGEKAMTAIALVFALFQLNPAPFCLLDEVDAPLDDANTDRYAKMVQKMSDKTQFLFITHNKIAMEIAQELIGVTMQEHGVSRIVTVDLASASNLASEEQAA